MYKVYLLVQLHHDTKNEKEVIKKKKKKGKKYFGLRHSIASMTGLLPERLRSTYLANSHGEIVATSNHVNLNVRGRVLLLKNSKISKM